MNEEEVQERKERLVRIAAIVYQHFRRKISQRETALFLERGTFCPDSSTAVRKREEPKPKRKKS